MATIVRPNTGLGVTHSTKEIVSSNSSSEDLLSHCSSSSDGDSEETFEDASENVSTGSDSGHSSHMTTSVEESSASNSSDDEAEKVTGVARLELNSCDGECPSLEESLREITRLLSMTLDNRFHEAYQGTEKWSHKSLYHALGKGTLSFLKGCLTLERPEIQKALEDLKNCIDVCQREKRHSITRAVWRPNYNTYTDVEVHAELCYAEALLMTALITFLEDQNFLNLVRGAFRIRTCFQSYKECYYILHNRTEWSSEFSRLHFESGVRMGIGTFNLMLSHMPSKVLKMLEYVGFSANRRQGLQELETSTLLTSGLRCPLAVLIMLAYQCYIEHIFGLGDGDMEMVERMLDYALGKHPDGAFFLLFLGRHRQLTGKIDQAIEALRQCIATQNEWKQFHNICYWELLWCYAAQCDWNNAAECTDILRKQCKWSPAAYTYQYATFLYMIMVEQNKPELREEITEVMKQVPGLRIRYAGKTIPAEKFAILQSQKYLAQNEKLLLPTIEFMYIWNIFAVMGRSPDLLNPIMERIDKALVEEEKRLGTGEPLDDYCRCMLLKGMCLRYLQRNDEVILPQSLPNLTHFCSSLHHIQSNKCFLQVIEHKDEIEVDTYLIPHATLELGLNYMGVGQFVESRQWLDNAKVHSGYALETIVHFRIHTACRTINQMSKDDEDGVKKSPTGGLRSIWSELSRRLTFGEKTTCVDEMREEEERAMIDTKTRL